MNKPATVTSVSPAKILKNNSQHPLYASQPAAGFPSPGDDLVEKALDLNDLLVENESSTFFVRVSGDSMEGARIFDGDILVVDRSVDAQSGHVVVAAIYGELVVKRLLSKDKELFLMSENEDYKPIPVDEVEGCYVWGVVTGSVRVIL